MRLNSKNLRSEINQAFIDSIFMAVQKIWQPAEILAELWQVVTGKLSKWMFLKRAIL